MLKIGLLEADELYDDLKADYQSYGHMFERFFRYQYPDAPWQFQFYPIQDGQFPDAGECDAYLITGSKSGVYDPEPWIEPLQRWIRKAFQRGERMLGVCFGHQILAHSLGGYAARSNKGWGIGVRESAVVELPDWASTKASRYRLIYSHRDQVERLPEGAIQIASCPFCRYAAYAIGNQVLGFQGHPEFTVNFIERLLPRRENCIGQMTYTNGMATLNQPTDQVLIGQWMMEFLTARASKMTPR